MIIESFAANKIGSMIRNNEINLDSTLIISTARGEDSIWRYIKGDLRRELLDKGILVYEPSFYPNKELFDEFQEEVNKLTEDELTLSGRKELTESMKRDVHNAVFEYIDYEERYLNQYADKLPVIEVEDNIERIILACNCGNGKLCHNQLLELILEVKVIKKQFDWNVEPMEFPELDNETLDTVYAQRAKKKRYDRLYMQKKRGG